jgi:hypothetical protein
MIAMATLMATVISAPAVLHISRQTRGSSRYKPVADKHVAQKNPRPLPNGIDGTTHKRHADGNELRAVHLWWQASMRHIQLSRQWQKSKRALILVRQRGSS